MDKILIMLERIYSERFWSRGKTELSLGINEAFCLEEEAANAELGI